MVRATAERGRVAVEDPLYVQSVEKAFRVLAAFDSGRPSLSLTEIAAATGLDKSAAQRFTHTLARLGYLRKVPETRRFELTTRTLELGYHYTRSSPLLEAALPKLLDLSRLTEESISLTVPDDTHIVYVSRLVSRHMLHTNVIIGTRLPAYCTAPGIAILSRLPLAEARATLRRSTLRPFTPHTTWRMPDLLAKLKGSAAQGYAIACEEIYANDVSVAAAILGPRGDPIAAITIAASKLRCSAEQAVERFAPLVVAAAGSLSRSAPPVAA